MNKMDFFRKIVVLVILFLPSTHALGQPYVGLASVLVEEGEMAEISCVTYAGSHSEYFWRKGESLHNSTEIAYFISGLPTDDSGRIKVTENGTLILKKVTLDDEGKYICRVSSEESDCHGEIFVFVQAVLQDFQLTIENCEPENSCVISTASINPTSLTCKATNASPSMKLKWFNGSHEITDNIQENSLTKGPSREISSTIRDVYKGPYPLTCQAVDFKTSNDDGMFAHVQFSTPAATADISLEWIVTAILFIIAFVILFIIVIFITVWPKVRNGKDVDTQIRAERESLLKTNNERLEAALQTKDDEIKNKNDEITNLNKALLDTRADKRVDESNVTSKDKKTQDKREQISKLEKREDELNLKESKLAEREAEIMKHLWNLERKKRKFRSDQMASKDPIRINCKLIASKTGGDARVATKEKGGQAMVTAKKKWDFTSKDAKFHTIYHANAEPKELCLSIVDLVENAIDGRNSCLVAHDVSGGEHWKTMLEPDEGASFALVPYAITKIFKRSKELKTLAYKVDVTARFKTISSELPIPESVKNKQYALELLKKWQQNMVDGSTDHFVQFSITTETDKEILAGNLILATIGSMQMIKECFLSIEPTTQLTQNISVIISDGRCRSVLLTHIHEDKLEETKDCLAMVKEVSKKNKK